MKKIAIIATLFCSMLVVSCSGDNSQASQFNKDITAAIEAGDMAKADDLMQQAYDWYEGLDDAEAQAAVESVLDLNALKIRKYGIQIHAALESGDSDALRDLLESIDDWAFDLGEKGGQFKSEVGYENYERILEAMESEEAIALESDSID